MYSLREEINMNFMHQCVKKARSLGYRAWLTNGGKRIHVHDENGLVFRYFNTETEDLEHDMERLKDKS